MPFVPIPDTARAVLRFQQFSDERQTVLHFKAVPGPITPALLQQLATDLETWWNSPGRNVASNQLALFEIVCTDISVPNGAQYSLPIIPPNPGTNAAGSAPGNVTSTVSWRTTKTGRRYRGRTYVPGFTDTVTTDDGLVTSAQVLNLISYAANLLFGTIQNPWYLAVASKVAQAAELVTNGVVENVLDSQRRRLPKRGI